MRLLAESSSVRSNHCEAAVKAGVQREDDDVPGQRVDALAAHGIALVRHGRRADLVLLERLLHLLEVPQQPHVVGELGGALRDPRQRRQARRVRLARVRLPRDAVHLVEPHLLGHQPVEALHALAVALEQVHERRLRPRGAAHPAEAQRVQAELHLLQVQQQVLDPERGSLADGGGLRRLEVREAQRGERPVLPRELRQRRHRGHQPRAHQLERLAVLDQVRVVAHVRAGGAQVDDGARSRRLFAQVVHVRHHVVA
jgi:hypothetical protein